ncbi:hypothetical protein V5E97_20785 [Singulisphaera sp. Ch08]|uniref:PEGA domain-containing protein n=1 Tax=Singulisphaera sp. Ch08 TaxID=3120278 RepID=A0AAU7C6P1_9BACT
MILQAIARRSCSGVLRNKIFGHICGWTFGGAMLCWVASQSGPRDGTAVVHVTEPDVVVSVGGQTFHVGESLHRPLVCDLPTGEHRLTMTRGATVLYAETFSITGGEEVVLSTWSPPSEGASQIANLPVIDPRRPFQNQSGAPPRESASRFPCP